MYEYRLGVLCLVAVVCSRYASASEDLTSIIRSTLTQSAIGCIAEHPLSLSDIKAFAEKRMPNSAKCFVACIFKAVGVMDNMGKLNANGAKESAKKIFKENQENKMKADQLVQQCLKVNEMKTSDGAKGCDRAKLLYECFTENAEKIGFNINFEDLGTG